MTTKTSICKDCKFFEFYYKNKWRKYKCKITKESLTLKSKSCDEYEIY